MMPKMEPKTDTKMDDAKNGKVNKAFENWIKLNYYTYITTLHHVFLQ